jgi:hypothetical protein
VRVEVAAEVEEAAVSGSRSGGQAAAAARRGTQGAATIESMMMVLRVATAALIAYQFLTAENNIERAEIIIDWAAVRSLPAPVAAFYLAMTRNYTESSACERAGSGVCQLQWEIERRTTE